MPLICLCLAILLQGAKSESNTWIDLFNGKNYTGFKFYIAAGPENTFDVKDECLYIKGPLAGYVYTKAKYRNYELKYEWKFERPENLASDEVFKGGSGVLLHITRILKQWPQSIEVDGRYQDVGKMNVYGKAQGEFQDYPDARRKSMKKVGEWNSTVIGSNDGKIEVRVNGHLVSQGTTDQREGFIGFQAKGTNILYRNIKLRVLE